MRLDLTSLRSALAARKEHWFPELEAGRERDLREQFRAAAIQVEFTHEVAFKMLKRQLSRWRPIPPPSTRCHMDNVRSARRPD